MFAHLLDAGSTGVRQPKPEATVQMMQNENGSPWLSNTALSFGLAAVYFIAGKSALRLAFVHGITPAVWPPAGIALAALLVLGYRVWPGIFLGAFLVNITTAGAVWTSLGVAASYTLAAVAGAWMTNRWAGGCGAFYHPQTVVKFEVSILLGATIAATLGPLSLAFGGFAPWGLYGSNWFAKWMGDAAGNLIIAPLLILWAKNPQVHWTRKQAFEAFLLVLTLLLVGQYVFHPWQPNRYRDFPTAFLVWPVLIWAALRFNPRETATTLFLISGFALYATINGHGPFSRESPNTNLMLLGGFHGVCNTMALIMAADVWERKKSHKALQKSHQDLERRVIERTADLTHANSALRSQILERQKAEQDVRRLVAIVESSEDAIIGMDTRGLIQSWNSGAEKLFGYSSKEVLGRSFNLLMPPDAKLQQEMLVITHKLNRGESSQYDTTRMRKDGTLLDVSVYVSLIRNEAGVIIGFSKIMRDITQHKQTENELQQKTEQLTRSNAELNLFASAVSHELMEPVRKIVGFGEMIKTGGGVLDSELDQYIGRMKNAAVRMQNLIEGLLNMSRVTTQSKPLEPVALDDVLKDVVSDFSARVEQAGGKIDVGPMPTVMADGLQMRQLFQNLISNAFKFRKTDDPLRIEISSSPPKSGFVEIVVKDNGIGFEEEYSSRIFKPFERLHRRGEYEGSGLGLAICERIALRHGGTITARSAPGKGSSFMVTLPA